MKAVQVLGQFDRGRLREEKWISHLFREFLWQRGIAIRTFDLQLEIRKPNHSLDDSVVRWHQDYNGSNRHMRFWLVMWSNKTPTRFRLKKSKRGIKVQSGDVVLIRNDLVEHRAPSADTGGRWFIRATDVRFLK